MILNAKVKSKTFLYIAGFHLGAPLNLFNRVQYYSAGDIREMILKHLLSHGYQIGDPDTDAEVFFPLGDPIRVSVPDEKVATQFSCGLRGVEPTSTSIHHNIWICNSGVVLLLGSIETDNPSEKAFGSFEDYVEDHYSSLSDIFVRCALPIYRVLGNPLIPICMQLTTLEKIMDKTIESKEKETLLESILIDVYYMEFGREPSGSIQSQVCRSDYIDSSFESEDMMYPFVIVVLFSSFVGLLWAQRHASNLFHYLHDFQTVNGRLSEVIRYVTSFRLYLLRLINESNPIHIRITRRYLCVMLEYWDRCMMTSLTETIHNHVAEFEEMLKAIEQKKKDQLNSRIGWLALIISLVSITAVISQIISTVDVQTALGVCERASLIAGGLIGGVILVFTIMKRGRPKKVV